MPSSTGRCDWATATDAMPPHIDELVVQRRSTDSDAAERFSVAGELDMESIDVLRAALDTVLDTGTADVELDLTEITFCDSIGLHLLLHTHHTLDTQGRRLLLVNPSHVLRRLLELTATVTLFDVVEPGCTTGHADAPCGIAGR
jgi:anti-anti-sigma factor